MEDQREDGTEEGVEIVVELRYESYWKAPTSIRVKAFRGNDLVKTMEITVEHLWNLIQEEEYE